MSSNWIPTIYADFNDRRGNALGLACNGTKADLERLGINLREGLELRVSDGDLDVTGIVRWSEEFDGGAVVIDMHKITDLHEAQHLDDSSS
jgi:hypothetical protein